MDDFGKFIVGHENDDPLAILLARDRWKDEVDVPLAVTTLQVRKRLKVKAPAWYANPSLTYPLPLGGEQCSSEATGRYKASVAQRLLSANPASASGPRRIADLTGGLGIDSWCFSKSGDCEVLYNEKNKSLADAALHNFTCLEASNISVRSSELVPGNLRTVLGDFRPDLIYLDPARRDDSGSKVFLPEECSPDVISLLDELLQECRFVMVKLSPMADISLLARRFGTRTREMHIVSEKGECKEILVVIDAYWNENFKLICREGENVLEMGSAVDERSLARYIPLPGSIDDLVGRVLFEPGKSLAKSGLFCSLCPLLSLEKFSPSTHLYLADKGLANLADKGLAILAENRESSPAEGLPVSAEEESEPELFKFGKLFIIKEIYPLTKQTLKAVGKAWPHSEVTARNIPMTSDELRRRMNVRSGDDAHIFAARIDFGRPEQNGAPGSPADGNYLMVTAPLTI